MRNTSNRLTTILLILGIAITNAASATPTTTTNPGTLLDNPTRSTNVQQTTNTFSPYARDAGSDVLYLNVTTPDTLDASKKVLFESGGGVYGINLYHQDNSLKVSIGSGNTLDLIANNVLLPNQRYLILLAISRNPNTIQAYMAEQTDNNLPSTITQVASVIWSGPNWSGGNGAGWGMKNSSIQGVNGGSNEAASFSNFNGSFHEGRFYSQRIIEEVWSDGDTTPEGRDGDSAYQVAVNNGFEGTEQEWLASLIGEQGATGTAGVQGEQGATGATGVSGIQGAQGEPGEDGTDGQDGVQGNTGTAGVQGEQGEPGQDGADGDSFFTQIGADATLDDNTNLVTTGDSYVQVGSSSASCSDVNAGAIRYNTSSKVLEFCNGTAWGGVNTIYDPSCGEACQLGSASSVGGYSHTCALKTDNTVECWGGNSYGQTDVPAGLGFVKQIALGTYQTCVLKTDNTVRCWGDDSRGQSTVPADLSTVKQIALGKQHTCALQTDNTVTCWGWNRDGQTTVPEDLIAKQL